MSFSTITFVQSCIFSQLSILAHEFHHVYFPETLTLNSKTELKEVKLEYHCSSSKVIVCSRLCERQISIMGNYPPRQRGFLIYF